MAYFLVLTTLITSVLLISTIPDVNASVLSIDVHNYTSPQVGSRVEILCYGSHAIEQRGGDQYFSNGGKLVWILDGEVIANASTVRDYDLNTDKYSLTVWKREWHSKTSTYFALTIKHVSVDDKGRYQCALFFNETTLDITSLTKDLIVQYPPSKLFPQCYVDSIQEHSSTATLRCRSETAYPSVKLYWMASGEILADDTSAKISDGYTAITTDIAVPLTSTEYVCVANYSGDFELVVRRCTVYPPVISLDPAVEVIEGGDAMFTCSVSAEPESEKGVLWTSVPPMTSRNTTTSHNDNSVSVLTVRNVTARENGTMIFCHSQNLLGESHRRSVMTVHIFGSPDGTYIPPLRVDVEPQIAEIMAGEIATFMCHVSTISNTFKYKWYYQDKEVNSDGENTRFWIGQRRLRISEVDVADNYAPIACEVTADGHTVTARAILHVIQPSTIHTPALGRVSNTEPPNFLSEYGTLIGLISAGLVAIVLILLIILLAIKSKQKCSNRRRNQRQVHNTSHDAVGYTTSIGQVHSFNNVFNDSQPGSPSPVADNLSTFSYNGAPKSTNEHRLVVNLPPMPPIPMEGAVGEGDTLKAAKKLAQLEDYEDMETIRANLYSATGSDGNNEYQQSIGAGGLWRSNSRPNGDGANMDTDLLPGQKMNLKSAEPLY